MRKRKLNAGTNYPLSPLLSAILTTHNKVLIRAPRSNIPVIEATANGYG